MYPIYSGPGNQYCSAGESHRINGKVSVSATYLGKVIDREKGIYQSKERGIFRFDMETGKFLAPPEDFDLKPETDKRIKKRSIVDFGDAFFLYALLKTKGFSSLLDDLLPKQDNLYATLLFYSLNDLANDKAQLWANGSITKVLFPNATMTSPGISYTLSRLGDEDLLKDFQEKWIHFVLTNISDETDVLVDSTGLPNSIKTCLTQLSAKNGKFSEEMRLTLLVQRSTGLPLFLSIDSGNIHDCNILPTVLLHADNLGLHVRSATVDCGYNTKANLDLFYDENHVCHTDFVTRARNDNTLRKVIEEMPDLRKPENFVQYRERFLFLGKTKYLVGSEKNQPAWLYVGLDLSRQKDEQDRAFRNAIRKGLSKEDVLEIVQTGGYFGLLSSREYSKEEILPIYYMRQNVEQTFDISKNYTKLLPIRNHSEKTIKGHIFLAYLDTILKVLLVEQLKKTSNCVEDALLSLRNQKATIYTNQVVIEPPGTEAREIYREFNLSVPTHLPLIEGRLDCQLEELKKEKKKRGRPKKKPEEKTEKKSAGKGSASKAGSPRTKESQKEESGQKPKKRGRKPGSKNLSPEERAAREAAKVKKPRGRSKKNPKEAEALRTISGKTRRSVKTGAERNPSQWEKAEKVRQAARAAEELREQKQRPNRKPRKN